MCSKRRKGDSLLWWRADVSGPGVEGCPEGVDVGLNHGVDVGGISAAHGANNRDVVGRTSLKDEAITLCASAHCQSQLAQLVGLKHVHAALIHDQVGMWSACGDEEVQMTF